MDEIEIIYISAKYFADGYDYANKETTKSKTYKSPHAFGNAVKYIYKDPDLRNKISSTSVDKLHYAWQITEGKSLDWKGLQDRLKAGNSEPDMWFLPEHYRG